MATGSATYGTIVVSPEPRGRFIEGIITTARYPGICVKHTTTAPQLGRHSFIPWITALTSIIVLREDNIQGLSVSHQYAAGARALLYIPLPGDELLMRCAGASYTIGQSMIPVNTTGVLTGGSAGAPFTSLEAVTLAEEELMLVMFNG